MEIDGFSSSPPAIYSELPPSSAPDPTPRANGSTPRRPIADALTMSIDPDKDASKTEGTSGRRKKQRQVNGEVPMVKDAVGEGVAESFETFLKTSVGLKFQITIYNRIFIRFTEDVALASTPGPDGAAGDAIEGELIYIEQIHTMREYELTTLYIDYGHLLQRDDILADAIQKQYYRFLPYLRRALLNLVTQHEPEYLKLNPTSATTDSSNLQTREFNVAFYHLPLVSGIRDLRTDKIGTLMSIGGTVTRTSEVRPELLFGSFICEVCGGIIHDIEQQFKYTEVGIFVPEIPSILIAIKPSLCPNPTCGNRSAWQLQIDSSKFTDWQKVRIQENPSEIPTGSMPRSLDVILRSEMVERAKAGDKCVFTGTFIVVPDVSQLGLPGGNKAELQREAARNMGTAASGVTGLKVLGVRDLQYKTAFLACMVNDADGRVSIPPSARVVSDAV